jgi:hypothetical protein
MVERKRAAALDAALAAMFRMFERRGVPDHIRRSLDQLDERNGEQEPKPERLRA